MIDYRALHRRLLLEKIYDHLSENDKKLFAQMTMQNKSANEIMDALNSINRKLDNNKHSFTSDLLANISGNVITDGVFFLFKKFLRM